VEGYVGGGKGNLCFNRKKKAHLEKDSVESPLRFSGVEKNEKLQTCGRGYASFGARD